MKTCVRVLLILVMGCNFCVAISIRGSSERVYIPDNPNTAELTCVADDESLLPGSVKWSRNEQELMGITGSSLDVITSLPDNYVQSYEGQYRCIHNNATSDPVNFYVLPEPVDNQNIEQVVTVGEDVIIQCPLRFGSLHQHHNVKWTVDGNPIQNSSTYSILNDPTERVIVNNVNPDHRIKFQCVSTLNGQRPVKSPVVLLMPYEAPRILNIIPASLVVIADDSSAIVFCEVAGVPRPDIEWCINGGCSSDWLNNTRYVVNIDNTSRPTLTISPATEEDIGAITCRLASNRTINMTTELFILFQIEVEIWRDQDDNVIIKVTLQREINFDYKILVYVNDQILKELDGILGKTDCNYTLSSNIEGEITARLSVGGQNGAITDSLEIPPSSDSEDSKKDGGQILIAVVVCVAVALIVCITVIVLYKKRSSSKQCNILRWHTAAGTPTATKATSYLFS